MQLYTKILIGMGAGVVLGFLVGPNSSLLPQDGVRLSKQAVVRTLPIDGASERQALAQGQRTARLIGRQTVGDTEWLNIEWTLTATAVKRLRPKLDERLKAELRVGMSASGWVENDPELVEVDDMAGVRLAKRADVRTLPDIGSQYNHILADGQERALVIGRRTIGDTEWLNIEWTLTAPDLLRLKPQLGEGLRKNLRAGTSTSGWITNDPAQADFYAPIGQTLVGSTEWIGRLFLKLIKMVVVPLVFFSLVVGVASLGDFRVLGRLGGRTLVYFTGTTVVALIIGVGLANIVQPGKWLSEADSARLKSSYSASVGDLEANASKAPSLGDQIVGIVPENPLYALGKGEMLQIIFFALMLGIALTLMKPDRAKPVVDVFDRINDAMIMLVHIAMGLAPFGVAALLFKVVGTTGISVLIALSAYGVVVVVGLLLHVFLTYGLVVQFGARLPLFGFFGAIKEALLVAFSTSSSSATLPVTKEACEDNLNVSPRITSFVLPLGATVNMDGTALYQGVAAIFIAQIYIADPLSFTDQATIVLSATLASVGAAGVPGAGMITLAMVLTAVGVPTEGLALILGVDRLLDMFRTTTNVVGDSTATALMARLEGEELRILSDEEDAMDPTRGFEGRLAQGAHPVPVDEDKAGA